MDADRRGDPAAGGRPRPVVLILALAASVLATSLAAAAAAGSRGDTYLAIRPPWISPEAAMARVVAAGGRPVAEPLPGVMTLVWPVDDRGKAGRIGLLVVPALLAGCGAGRGDR